MEINEEGISELRFEVKDEIICQRFGIQHDYHYGRPYYKSLPKIINFANIHELKNTIELLMDLYNKVVEERIDKLNISHYSDSELSFKQALNKLFYEINKGIYYKK